MSIATTDPTFLDPFALPSEPVKRFTVEEYHTLIRAGILAEGDPYELVEGWLLTKVTKNPPHDAKVNYLAQFFTRHLPDGWHCRIQSAVTLPDGEPEPDLAIVRGKPLDFGDKHPGPEAIALVIEVAEASYKRDSTLKLRCYAGAGIGQYWIVNLNAQQLEVYRQPDSARQTLAYNQRLVYKNGDTAALILDRGVSIDLPLVDLL